MKEHALAKEIASFTERMQSEPVSTNEVYQLLLRAFLEINRQHYQIGVLTHESV